MKQLKDAPIGVFDSGVGGLTVAREIMRNLPKEKIVYFGDTARVPYGSKSKETIIRYSRQIVRFLKTQDVKAIVVACNTASALALETISAETDLPMIGVVEPGAKVAVETTRNKKIGLIGTRATVKSGLYQRVIQKEDPEIQVSGQPEKIHSFQKIPRQAYAAHKPDGGILLVLIASQAKASLKKDKCQNQKSGEHCQGRPHNFSCIRGSLYISQSYGQKGKRQKHTQHLPAPPGPAGKRQLSHLFQVLRPYLNGS